MGMERNRWVKGEAEIARVRILKMEEMGKKL
jgi:hypothetical protein